MKKLSMAFGFVLLAVLAGGLAVNKYVSSPPAEPVKNKIAASLWSKKQTPQPSLDRGLSDREMLGTETDTKTAGKFLGFEITLPKSPKAAAAGPAQVLGEENIAEIVKKHGTALKPYPPYWSGAAVQVKYPNGLKMLIQIRHPDDPTMNYEGYTKTRNTERDIWAAKGFFSNNQWELTTVNGFQGIQRDQGWVFNGSSDETPTPDRRIAQGATVIWYDDKNWVEYTAKGPIGADLAELRQVVDSIY